MHVSVPEDYATRLRHPMTATGQQLANSSTAPLQRLAAARQPNEQRECVDLLPRELDEARQWFPIHFVIRQEVSR